MALHQVGNYEHLGDYSFEDLPKGKMLEISINPYNGNIFISVSRRRASGKIALEVMRQFVELCDEMERRGYEDPINAIMSECDTGQKMVTLSCIAKLKIKAIPGRRYEKDSRECADDENVTDDTNWRFEENAC